MSKKWKGCSRWAHKNNSPGYQEWRANHVCQANHSGSSGSMEPTANTFNINNFRYTNYIYIYIYIVFVLCIYIDSSVFNTIKESKPYSDTIITKLECVGHVQKRLDTRCRKLRVT